MQAGFPPPAPSPLVAALLASWELLLGFSAPAQAEGLLGIAYATDPATGEQVLFLDLSPPASSYVYGAAPARRRGMHAVLPPPALALEGEAARMPAPRLVAIVGGSGRRPTSAQGDSPPGVLGRRLTSGSGASGGVTLGMTVLIPATPQLGDDGAGAATVSAQAAAVRARINAINGTMQAAGALGAALAAAVAAVAGASLVPPSAITAVPLLGQYSVVYPCLRNDSGCALGGAAASSGGGRLSPGAASGVAIAVIVCVALAAWGAAILVSRERDKSHAAAAANAAAVLRAHKSGVGRGSRSAMQAVPLHVAAAASFKSGGLARRVGPAGGGVGGAGGPPQTRLRQLQSLLLSGGGGAAADGGPSDEAGSVSEDPTSLEHGGRGAAASTAAAGGSRALQSIASHARISLAPYRAPGAGVALLEAGARSGGRAATGSPSRPTGRFGSTPGTVTHASPAALSPALRTAARAALQAEKHAASAAAAAHSASSPRSPPTGGASGGVSGLVVVSPRSGAAAAINPFSPSRLNQSPPGQAARGAAGMHGSPAEPWEYGANTPTRRVMQQHQQSMLRQPSFAHSLGPPGVQQQAAPRLLQATHGVSSYRNGVAGLQPPPPQFYVGVPPITAGVGEAGPGARQQQEYAFAVAHPRLLQSQAQQQQRHVAKQTQQPTPVALYTPYAYSAQQFVGAGSSRRDTTQLPLSPSERHITSSSFSQQQQLQALSAQSQSQSPQPRGLARAPSDGNSSSRSRLGRGDVLPYSAASASPGGRYPTAGGAVVGGRPPGGILAGPAVSIVPSISAQDAAGADFLFTVMHPTARGGSAQPLGAHPAEGSPAVHLRGMSQYGSSSALRSGRLPPPSRRRLREDAAANAAATGNSASYSDGGEVSP